MRKSTQILYHLYNAKNHELSREELAKRMGLTDARNQLDGFIFSLMVWRRIKRRIVREGYNGYMRVTYYFLNKKPWVMNLIQYKLKKEEGIDVVGHNPNK